MRVQDVITYVMFIEMELDVSLIFHVSQPEPSYCSHSALESSHVYIPNYGKNVYRLNLRCGN